MRRRGRRAYVSLMQVLADQEALMNAEAEGESERDRAAKEFQEREQRSVEEREASKRLEAARDAEQKAWDEKYKEVQGELAENFVSMLAEKISKLVIFSKKFSASVILGRCSRFVVFGRFFFLCHFRRFLCFGLLRRVSLLF